MRRDHRIFEEQLLQAGWALTGGAFLTAAALAAELARRHMVALGSICGAAEAHCGWCFAAAGLAVAGIAALVAAVRRPAILRA